MQGKSSKSTLNDNLKIQLAQIYGNSCNEMCTDIRKVQQQDNSIDLDFLLLQTFLNLLVIGTKV